MGDCLYTRKERKEREGGERVIRVCYVYEWQRRFNSDSRHTNCSAQNVSHFFSHTRERAVNVSLSPCVVFFAKKRGRLDVVYKNFHAIGTEQLRPRKRRGSFFRLTLRIKRRVLVLRFFVFSPKQSESEGERAREGAVPLLSSHQPSLPPSFNNQRPRNVSSR